MCWAKEISNYSYYIPLTTLYLYSTLSLAFKLTYHKPQCFSMLIFIFSSFSTKRLFKASTYEPLYIYTYSLRSTNTDALTEAVQHLPSTPEPSLYSYAAISAWELSSGCVASWTTFCDYPVLLVSLAPGARRSLGPHGGSTLDTTASHTNFVCC